MMSSVSEWFRMSGGWSYLIVLCAMGGVLMGLVRGVLIAAKRWRVPAALVWTPAAACVGVGILGQMIGVIELFEALASATPETRALLVTQGYSLAHYTRVGGFIAASGVLTWGALTGGMGLALSGRDGNTKTGIESALVWVLGWGAAAGVIVLSGMYGPDLGWALGVVLGASVLGCIGASTYSSDDIDEAARLAGGRAATWCMALGATASGAMGLWTLNQSEMLGGLSRSSSDVRGMLVQAALDVEYGITLAAGAAGAGLAVVGVVMLARHVPYLGQLRVWVGALVVALICAAFATPQLALDHQLGTIQSAFRSIEGERSGVSNPPLAVNLDGSPSFVMPGAEGCVVARGAKGEGWRGCWSAKGPKPPYAWTDRRLLFDVPADLPARRIAREAWFKGRGDLGVIVPYTDAKVNPYPAISNTGAVSVHWLMPPGHAHEEALRQSKGAQMAALRGHPLYLHTGHLPHALIEHQGQAWWVSPNGAKALGVLSEPGALDKALRGVREMPKHALVVVGEAWTVQDLVSICLAMETRGPACVLAQESPEAFIEQRGLTLE